MQSSDGPHDLIEGDEDSLEIAIVGMAGKFPGADNIDEYWRNLINGVESISELTDDELRAAGIDEATIANPNYVKAAPRLKSDPGFFDAAFFGYSPREAQYMDPQQRLFLETAWLAVEHSGYAPQTLDFPVGVFGGSALNTYFMKTQLTDRFDEEYLPTLIGNDNSFLATRVSYKLNFVGPSVTVQTACSTSLVAVHQACQSLLNNECDMALAGGVSVRVPQNAGYLFQDGSVASPDGHCRTFDADAKGTLFGSGVGVVVLKRLVNAIEDGDHIFAVVKGSAINNDGSSKVDYTAPSVKSQADVIAEALSVAGVTADSISYVEAHGTGTYLGDPIEVAALTKAFRGDTDQAGYCAIGSVKTNIGHLDAAAGVAGLIKVALALQHRQLPATLHYRNTNPQIDFAASPFYVNDRLREWETRGSEPRRAGITSLGIGGTNAHVILEEAPQPQETKRVRHHQLLCWSGQTEQARDALADDYADVFQNSSHLLHDAAFTMQVGRKRLKHRSIAVATDFATASEMLRVRSPGDVLHAVGGDSERDAVFMFTGQGSQYVHMTKLLYEREPVYREVLDSCFRVLDREVELAPDERLCNLLLPATGDEESAPARLVQTSITQPVLFSIEYSLARLLMHWGVHPTALVGHSVGEYVAACLSGVFALDDALRLIAIRGRLMQSQPSGSMLAVLQSAEDVTPMLSGDLALAVVNGPNTCVVSGEDAAMRDFVRRLDERGVEHRALRTSHAFHSPMMDPILEEFTHAVAQAGPKRPEIPIVSNVSGTWMSVQDATDPAYWARQLRSTVRFYDCLTTLMSDPDRVLVEVGPGSTLASLARQHPEKQKSHAVVTTCRRAKDETEDDVFLLRALGQLWMSGLDVDWHAFHGEPRRRVPLPGYPFERKRHWYQPHGSGSTQVKRCDDIGDWFYTRSWTQSVLAGGQSKITPGETWLILSNDAEISAGLADRCRAAGGTSWIATTRGGPSDAQIRGTHLREDYRKLVERAGFPSRVFYVTDRQDTQRAANSNRQFLELFHLAGALSDVAAPENASLKLCVLTDGVATVLPEESLDVNQSLVLGPARVMPKELPFVESTIVDIQRDHFDVSSIVDLAINESDNAGKGEIVAWRGGQRWRQATQPVHLSSPDRDAIPLRSGGVYLITGGLGGVGMTVAMHLARKYHAKLILTSRTTLPAREQWGAPLRYESDDVLKRHVRSLLDLEEAGAEVTFISGDIADAGHASKLAEVVLDRYGHLDGAFHAAGCIRDSLMSLKTEESARQVLAPKVSGTENLCAALHSLSPNFVVLFSSVNALLAPAGQADYASANAYLDSFALRTIATRVLSINWPGWQDVGLVAAMPDSTWRRDAIAHGVSSTDAMEVLERALAQTSCSQLLVSPTRFEFPSPKPVTVSATVIADTGNHVAEFADGGESTEAVFYGSQTEEAVARVWEELLGVEKPAPTDNYFDLGGSSLLATQMISRLQQQLGKKLTVRDVLDNPTVGQLSKLIESGTPAEEPPKPVVDDKAMSVPAIASAAAAIPKRDQPLQPSRLSRAQARMWYMHKLHPESVADNLAVAYRLRGAVNVDGLKASLQALTLRHESLRTVFEVQGGAPVQVVLESTDFALGEVDLRPFSPDQVERELQRSTTGFARQPFDLENGPLFRAKLFQLSEQDHVLVLNMHHIISDGWSCGVLERELQNLYRSYQEGNRKLDAMVRAAPIQYADYATWESQISPDEQLGYWRNQLAGDPPSAEIPTDSSRPTLQTFEGRKYHFEISAETHLRLQNLCQEENATTFMGLLATLNVLIYRYSGLDDIVIGTPISLRSQPELESVVGIFLNLLPLRTRLEGQLSGRELLGRVRDVTLDGYAHREAPFSLIVEQLDRAMDPSRSPLFQIMLQVSPASQMSLVGLEIESFPIESGTAQFDIAFHLCEQSGGMHGHIEYNTALYTLEVIERLAGHFVALLESLLVAPDNPVSSLPMLPPEERARQLVVWNATYVDENIDISIHDVFRESARKWPTNVAVECRRRSLTYQELDRESDRLAMELRQHGAAPGTYVGVYMERSSELLVALLGVLKSGAAYIPLDPSFPNERLSYMLSNSGAPIVLTQSSLLPLPLEHNAEVVTVDDDLNTSERDFEQDRSAATDPAYVIYTSGSTGLPKGVQISHRAAVNFLKSMAREPGMSSTDTALAITTLSFDIALLELFLPLFVGAKVYIVARNDALDGRRLSSLIEQTSPTLMQATPATWRMLLDTGWKGVTDRSFKVLCGGEPLPMDLAHDLLDRCSELWNMYGPTETTVWSTLAQVKSKDERITIGRPINNTEIYILDDQLQPVPVGVPGVLYIGGDGLADGYHGLPDLTSEKFISDPFSSVDGKRIYNTGDLARYLSVNDGTIEHLGRIDGQVKVRGFRIELGEIESVLAQYPGVERAVVIDWEEHGEKWLVGYLVTADAVKPSVSELRRFLSKSLPEYMVPAAFVMLDQIPLTPNNKVDRRALPTPQMERPELEHEYTPASTAVETKLVEVWERLLKRRPIGVRDNFFDLGGTSLKAVRLFNWIEEEFDERLSLGSLFETPTIETLGARLVQRSSGVPEHRRWECLIPIRASGNKPPLYLIHAAGGNVLLYSDLARHLGPDQPVYGLQSFGLDGRNKPHDCVEDMAAHYLEEIKANQPRGPYYVGGYCLGGTIALDIANRLRAAGEEVAMVALLETYNWVNIGKMSPFARLRFLYEQIAFHSWNVAMLDSTQRSRFLRHKWDVAKQRSGMWLRSWWRKLGGDAESTAATIRSLNHRTSYTYEPVPYDGRITHFRPRREYHAVRSPRMLWDSLAADGVESVFLKAYPAGTLLEPFVQELAQELTKRIDKTLGERRQRELSSSV